MNSLDKSSFPCQSQEIFKKQQQKWDKSLLHLGVFDFCQLAYFMHHDYFGYLFNLGWGLSDSFSYYNMQENLYTTKEQEQQLWLLTWYLIELQEDTAHMIVKINLAAQSSKLL